MQSIVIKGEYSDITYCDYPIDIIDSVVPETWDGNCHTAFIHFKEKDEPERITLYNFEVFNDMLHNLRTSSKNVSIWIVSGTAVWSAKKGLS